MQEPAGINEWNNDGGASTDALRETIYSQEHLSLTRILLSRLLCHGLSHSIDGIALHNLHIPLYEGQHLAFKDSFSDWQLVDTEKGTIWSTSRTDTAKRLFLLLSLLRTFLNFSSMFCYYTGSRHADARSIDIEREVTEVITYYASFLPERIGSSYLPADLGFLACYWFDSIRASLLDDSMERFD